MAAVPVAYVPLCTIFGIIFGIYSTTNGVIGRPCVSDHVEQGMPSAVVTPSRPRPAGFGGLATVV